MNRTLLLRFALAIQLVPTHTALAQDEIYVSNSNSNSVTAHAINANGNAAPLRVLAGNATGLGSPSGIAVDLINNELFVVNKSLPYSVTVYPRLANGNVAPLRTISGALTDLNDPRGIAVDTLNNEIAVANRAGFSVTVYSRTSTGNVAPLRTLLNTGFSNPWGVLIDVSHNEIAVANNGNLLSVYPRTGNGNVAPIRTISGSNTGFNNGPIGIALDPGRDSYYVTNPFYEITFDPAVLKFPRTASGNVSATAVWGGSSSGMSSPNGVALNADTDEIMVANSGGNSVTVYSQFLTGAITSLRTLVGANTQLGNPQFIVALPGPLFADGFDPAQ